MAKKYWFKSKQYGWGWYPSSWQGWISIGIFILVNLYFFYTLDGASSSADDFLIKFIPYSLFLTLLLVFLCFLKGEKPGWHWGNKKSKRK